MLKIFKKFLKLYAIITALVILPIIIMAFATSIYYRIYPERNYNKVLDINLEHPNKHEKVFYDGGMDPGYLYIWYYSENSIDKMVKQEYWNPMDECKVREIVNNYFLKWYDGDIKEHKKILEKYKEKIDDNVFENSKNYYSFFEIDNNYVLLILDIDKKIIYDFYVNY